MRPLLLDVNVVVAAFREDHTHHAFVRRWLDTMLAERGGFGVPAQVWGSFLRLVTSRRIYPVPTPLPEAFAFVDAIVTQPGHIRVEPGRRHLTLLRTLCDDGGATGDLVPDAVLAAIAVENGCAVATMDRDFARFPSVEHVLLRA